MWLLADYVGGWAAFTVSILIIGLLTAVIGDVAAHFGCTVGLKDSVTALTFVALGTSVPGLTRVWWLAFCVKQASHFARRTVYAMARNLACHLGKNSWHCAWGCAMTRVRWSSACHVVAKIILKCSKIYFEGAPRLVTTKLLTAGAWNWMSRISWTVRNLCVTDDNMAQTMRHFAILTDFVPLEWHDVARHIAGHCQCEACLMLITAVS